MCTRPSRALSACHPPSLDCPVQRLELELIRVLLLAHMQHALHESGSASSQITTEVSRHEKLLVCLMVVFMLLKQEKRFD